MPKNSPNTIQEEDLEDFSSSDYDSASDLEQAHAPLSEERRKVFHPHKLEKVYQRGLLPMAPLTEADLKGMGRGHIGMRGLGLKKAIREIFSDAM